MAAILAWAKRVPETFLSEPPKYWNFPIPTLDRVEGSTVALVGLGGIGAAITAAVIGPFVSMLRGWYMCFWPFVSIAVVTITSVGGYALVGFSERYWH